MAFKEIFDIWKKTNLLEKAFNESFEMIDLDKEMFNHAINAFLEQKNGSRVKKVFQDDKPTAEKCEERNLNLPCS